MKEEKVVQDSQIETKKKEEEFTPKIIAFCCYPSAYESADMAGEMRLTFPEGLKIVRVPCSGRVDLIYILKAFEMGFDGVMIMACHEDNCKYLRGNYRARKRVQYIKGILEELGLEKERVELFNLAANMGKRFSEMVNHMNQTIKSLGPSPLK